MASVWDWIIAYRRDAAARGDVQRLRLPQLRSAALTYSETDPDRALALLAEGRQLAQVLGEARWLLVFDHWRLQVLLHDKKDFTSSGDLAVRAALEARRPQFADLPQRDCLQEDLISWYLGVDPRGHETLIEQALAFMEGDVAADQECRHCLANCRTRLELARGRGEQARSAGLRALELAEECGEDHYCVNAYLTLCAQAFLVGDNTALAEWAQAGEEVARGMDSRKLALAELLLWRALAARRCGDEEQASRLFRSANARLGRLKAIPGSGWFDAWCAYQEQGGQLVKALEGRDKELRAQEQSGRHAYEAHIRLERCKLLARLGRLTDEECQATAAAADRLRDPTPYRTELQRLASGGTASAGRDEGGGMRDEKGNHLPSSLIPYPSSLPSTDGR